MLRKWIGSTPETKADSKASHAKDKDDVESSVIEWDEFERDVDDDQVNPDLSASNVTEGGEDITIIIDRTNGGLLGVDVDYRDGESLLVNAVTGGLIQGWNKTNPFNQVRIGDRVVEVNGIRGNVLQLVDECSRDVVLTMVIKKAEKDSLAAPAGSRPPRHTMVVIPRRNDLEVFGKEDAKDRRARVLREIRGETEIEAPDEDKESEEPVVPATKQNTLACWCCKADPKESMLDGEAAVQYITEDSSIGLRSPVRSATQFLAMQRAISERVTVTPGVSMSRPSAEMRPRGPV